MDRTGDKVVSRGRKNLHDLDSALEARFDPLLEAPVVLGPDVWGLDFMAVRGRQEIAGFPERTVKMIKQVLAQLVHRSRVGMDLPEPPVDLAGLGKGCDQLSADLPAEKWLGVEVATDLPFEEVLAQFFVPLLFWRLRLLRVEDSLLLRGAPKRP